MTLTLYHSAGSRGVRALWTLEEMALPYELVALPFPPRFRAPWFLSVNPLGTTPALVDGEATLTESAAIAQYLATRFGPSSLAVAPDEPDYGLFLDFLHHAEGTLTFPQTVFLRFTRLEPGRNLQAAGALYGDWFKARLVRVRERLSTRSFLCADRFTAADIALAYTLLLARNISLLDTDETVLNLYLDRMLARPSYARVLAAQEAASKRIAVEVPE